MLNNPSIPINAPEISDVEPIVKPGRGRPKVRPTNPNLNYYMTLIQRLLRSYPNITVSMMGSHLSPYGRKWREALDIMVDQEYIAKTLRPATDNISRSTFSYCLTELGLDIIPDHPEFSIDITNTINS